MSHSGAVKHIKIAKAFACLPLRSLGEGISDELLDQLDHELGLLADKDAAADAIWDKKLRSKDGDPCTALSEEQVPQGESSTPSTASTTAKKAKQLQSGVESQTWQELTNAMKAFMARVVPWPTNDEPGYINVHWHLPGARFRGRAVRSIHEFCEIATGLHDWRADPALLECKRSNLYFCLSRQAKAKAVNDHLEAERKTEDALAFKSIWLDIDVKDKGYLTINEAIDALFEFIKHYKLPCPSAVVISGSGLHVYWISNRSLPYVEWRPYAEGLKTAPLQWGLKCDAGLTANAACVLRIPGSKNFKTDPPKPVRLELIRDEDIDFAAGLKTLLNLSPRTNGAGAAPRNELKIPAAFAHLPVRNLGEGIKLSEFPPLPFTPIKAECGWLRHVHETGGADQDEPLWRDALRICMFLEKGESLIHEFSSKHADYDIEETEAKFERARKAKEEKDLGYPKCQTICDHGSEQCKTCSHLAAEGSPLHLAWQQQEPPPTEASFADPYAEFVGPPFPLDVLPPTLVKFVQTEQRAMGADPSALAMAALAAVASAIHAETLIRAGEGWWERPILWVFLIGDPSTMKTPTIEKATKPLYRIEYEQNKTWQQEYKQWRQSQQAAEKTPPPARQPRHILDEITPEKVAEILSRSPRGSLMVQDELASWIEGFERYNAGSSRGFFLRCWKGGTFLKDRVGKGKNDQDAEVRVENLALCVLGGIQPDRLTQMGDLTSDGLLQRALPCLMRPAEREDVYHLVAEANAQYDRLIRSLNDTPPENYLFDQDALEVRDRISAQLFKLEHFDGFSAALRGAIGKLKGYFARICLVLEVAKRHDPARSEGVGISKLFEGHAIKNLATGINSSKTISRATAEAAGKILNEFLLPHIFGLYDVVANGGQERDMLRSIGDFILATTKDRLLPSDLTRGVRALRGQPEHKIREWAGRFIGMGWLQGVEVRPGVPPKAWLVVPGLREHFAERQKHAEAARAEAHAILKAGSREHRHG